MARRKRSSAGGSLDSLLDTMTNVVGILVILLTVTQLGVQDAVERIGKDTTIDPAELAAAQDNADELQAQREELERQLAALEAGPEGMQKEVARLQREIRNQEATLEQIRQLMNDEKAARLAAAEEAAAAKLAEIEAHQMAMAELQKKYDANANHIQSLRAKLAAAPMVSRLPPKIVHLPNPRPAPEGAEPLTFICREGKIYFANLELHQNRAVKWTDAEVKRRRLDRDPAKGVDTGPLFASFNRQRFRDKWFQTKLEARGRLPYLVLMRQEHGGETLEEIRKATSDYQKGLAGVDSKKFYLRFLVWNDSFELYLAARQIAADQGFAAGWQPMTTKDEYRVRLASKLRHGPPPPPPKDPPKPNPNPKPPVDPPKPPPVDVID